MHIISIVLGIFAIWRGTRDAPRGTVFAAGVLFSVIGWAIDRGPAWPIQSIAGDMKIVGFVALCVGGMELAWVLIEAVRARRERRKELENFSVAQLTARIHDLVAKHPGEQITFEVVASGPVDLL